VQDHITKELWQSLNDFYHTVRNGQLVNWLQKEDPITIIDELVKKALLFYGTADITMARGEGYSFMNIGRYLERAIQSADILDIKFADTQYDIDNSMDTAYWKYLLLSISGYELYLKNNANGFEGKKVMYQVINDNQFPRSVTYSINQLARYFERLRGNGNESAFSKIEFMIGGVNSQVKYSTTENILNQGLHNFLAKLKNDLYAVGNALNQHYFAYT
jgi:uncharacterized alpha-E superfamily protein